MKLRYFTHCFLSRFYGQYVSNKKLINKNQKQSYRDVLRKTCSKYMQKIYKKTAMSKCNVNKVALQLIENAFWQECSPADLLHTFRTLFYKNSYERGPPMWFLLVL